MRNTTDRRFSTVQFACFFLAALVPWLMIYPHYRQLLDLTVGSLAVFLLTFAGTLLCRRAAARRGRAPGPIVVRAHRDRAVQRRSRRRVW